MDATRRKDAGGALQKVDSGGTEVEGMVAETSGPVVALWESREGES